MLHKLSERPASVVVFSSGKRNPVDCFLEFDMTFEVRGNQRLLQPAQAVGSKPLGDSDCKLYVEAHDRVVHKLGVRADGFTGLGDLLLNDVESVDSLVVVSRVRHLEVLESQLFGPVEVV